MAASGVNAVSSRATKVFIGAAADDVNTEAQARTDSNYSTGDISGLIKSVSMSITANTTDETVLNSVIGQTHKDINDITLNITWRATKTARTRAIAYALQDNTVGWDIRVSFDGTGSGETFYWGRGVFTMGDPASNAKTTQSVTSTFTFNTFNTSTHT